MASCPDYTTTKSAYGSLPQLDHDPLPPAWHGPVRAAITDLIGAMTAADLAILARLRGAGGYSERTQNVSRISIPDHAQQELPVTVTLLEWHAQRALGPALATLVAILVNAAMGPESRDSRREITSLAQMVRGAIRSPVAPLRVLVAEARDLPDLIRHVDEAVDAGTKLHITFVSLWVRWMRHRIARWILAEPLYLRREMLAQSNELRDDPDASELDAWQSPDADPDDRQQLASTPLDEALCGGLSPRATHAVATAQRILRRSGQSELALQADHFLPDALVCLIAQGALDAAEKALASALAERAEDYTALAFAIATGTRPIDVNRIRWGDDSSVDGDYLDMHDPVWSVTVHAPRSAVRPHASAFLKATTDRLSWPLPPRLYRMLHNLASEGPEAGVPAFPLGYYASSSNSGRLRAALARLAPEAQIGTGRLRLALAAHLTERHGPEVAQIVLRDSLSTSLGPVYYSSVPESSVTSTLCDVLSHWFDEPVAHFPERARYFGSRLVLSEIAAAEWPRMLAKETYSAARRKSSDTDLLTAERNHLAAALCAATGLRPGKSVATLSLDSVIPEYGLVILQDKQTDLLRSTRVAATGSRWTSALKAYIERVVELSLGGQPANAAWAHSVLASEVSLFSLPDDNGVLQPLLMETIRATMPSSLRAYENHYRHRLNQCLQTRGVDWELRHAQLGWVVTPAHALSDQSPISAREFGERLGPVIDDILETDGWYSRRGRLHQWTWEKIPQRPAKNWSAELHKYEREHVAHVRLVREEFKQRRRDAEAEVLPQVVDAVTTLIPALRVDQERRELSLAPGFDRDAPVSLTPDHYALIRDKVSAQQGKVLAPFAAAVAEYLIYELVVKAIRQGIVNGPVPRRRHLGCTAQLSPFLPGSGLAVRHAEAIRRRLIELAAIDSPRDRTAVAQLCVIANTPYRDFDRAAAVLAAASKSVRSKALSEWLLVPAGRDRKELPLALGGVTAVVIGRRAREAPKAKPMSRHALSRWIGKRFEDVLVLPELADERLSYVVDALRIAGRLELAGPDRMVMEGLPLGSASVDRIVAKHDDWPLRTGWDEPADASDVCQTRQVNRPKKGKSPYVDWSVYSALTSVLNPRSSRHDVVSTRGSKRAWRKRLERALVGLESRVEGDSSLGLVIQFALNRLRFGGKHRKHLSRGELHKEITRFAGALLSVLGPRSLVCLSGQQMQVIFLAVLCRKARNSRADVLEELVKFHSYLVLHHQVPEVSFAELRTFVGPRVRSADPGLLTSREIQRTVAELFADVQRTNARVDAAPEAIRVCALRVLMYLILEASGVRPGSAYGLVLGDIHLREGGGDFVHVHRTGDYGESKTETSVGYVPLEGELWAQHKQWVAGWLAREKSALGEDWWKCPAFSDAPGSRTRFALGYITRRIDALHKWVCDEPRARTYWLRKNRLTHRVGMAVKGSDPKARHVYRALRSSGQSGAVTPWTHYVNDVSVSVGAYLGHANRPDRAAVLAYSALRPTPLDQAWHGQRKRKMVRHYDPVMRRLGVLFAASPEERLTSAPVLRWQSPIMPANIDRYARELQTHSDMIQAMIRSGLSDVQVVTLEKAAAQMLIQRGCAPWQVPGMRQSTAIIQPARHLAGTTALFRELESEPDENLLLLAEAWMLQAHLGRMHTRSVVLVLHTQELADAAQILLGRTGLNLSITTNAEGVLVLCAPQDHSTGRTHADALRWILLICQMHSQIMLSRQ